MLIGTNMLFRLLYFVTAMSPAYILFTTAFIPTQGNLIKFDCPIHVSVTLIVLLLELVISVLFTWKLINLLQKQSDLQNGGVKKGVVMRKMNEGLVEFLMGIAVSSTIGLSLSASRPILSVIILCMFQILLFFLFQSSTNSMPNVFLVLGGWSYVRWGESYLFMPSKSFRDLVGKTVSGTPIGDSVSGSYVLVEKKDDEDND